MRSDGTFTRDFLYIKDAVMINFLLMDKMTNSDNPFKYGSAYNFSLEIELSVIEIVNKLLKLCGSKTEVEIISNATQETPNMLLDCKKAKKELAGHKIEVVYNF